jgi:hypothetical protein
MPTRATISHEVRRSDPFTASSHLGSLGHAHGVRAQLQAARERSGTNSPNPGEAAERVPLYGRFTRRPRLIAGDGRVSGRSQRKEPQLRGAGRVVFAAVMLLVLGTLNIIYGIGALDDANIFTNDTRYILTNLNTLGWVLIILGVIQLTGGFSLMAGNVYGRVIGIVGGSLGAIGALLSIGGNYPWWSLGIFVLCIWVVHGIIVYGEEERRAV